MFHLEMFDNKKKTVQVLLIMSIKDARVFCALFVRVKTLTN